MGTSLAFHIILAALGVGLPLLLCIAEGLALRTGDGVWLTLARRWSRAFGILFAVGAVSGTILSFELGLLWPTFMRFSGSVIGLPFAMEGFAFFLEAIFLGLYLYGWERLSPRNHWLCSIPLVVSGAASAWFVVSANSWMNTPAGFVVKNGQVTGIDPIAAVLNPSTPYETVHMLLAAYMATGFGVAGLCALGILRGNKSAWIKRGLMLSLAVGAIAAPLQIVSGDFNARFLAERQPAKFAAMEVVYKTGKNIPITIGGLTDPKLGKTPFSIEIPGFLSILVGGNSQAKITGLDAFAPQDRPNPQLVHPFFDMMVGIGFFTLAAAAVFWFLWWRRKRQMPQDRWLLWGLIAAGPLAFLAIEFGWMVTEEGRQPWIIQGVLRTQDAVTTAPGIAVTFFVFNLIYIALAVVTVILLRRLDDTSAHQEAPEASAGIDGGKLAKGGAA
jgi:cytochrome d ubiquinol oxidase subunit I